MDRDGPAKQGQRWLIEALTWLLAGAFLATLGYLVVARRGNLGWDDADYLRRGLADARLAVAGGGPGMLLRVPERLLREQPKPPLLVGWIMLAVLAIGRSSIDLIMLHGSVLPFGLLIATVVILARRYHGAWGGLLALLLLLISPRMLAFGEKVMVETFLGLFVLLSLALGSAMFERPSRALGIALGSVVGLAFLTKLTAALLLGGGFGLWLFWALRPGLERTRRLRALLWAIAACLVVAGPWYVRNAPAAIRFASYSSRFQLVAEGRTDVLPCGDRLARLILDLPGLPLSTLLALAGLCLAVNRRKEPREIRLRNSSRGQISGCLGQSEAMPQSRGRRSGAALTPPQPSDAATRFDQMVAFTTATAAGVLLIPAYFDSRFLLPLWPSLAVALGGTTKRWLAILTPMSRVAAASALLASLAVSTLGVVREPVETTCWAAGELIDLLVARHGVAFLGNVGDTPGWNVCKTGLVNELRNDPGSCFVLHDLSAESAEGLHSRVGRFDALVVLWPDAYPPGFREGAPGLNRASSLIDEVVRNDPQLVPMTGLPLVGFPPLEIFVRMGRAPEQRAAARSTPKRR
jgi:hypothetical protein